MPKLPDDPLGQAEWEEAQRIEAEYEASAEPRLRRARRVAQRGPEFLGRFGGVVIFAQADLAVECGHQHLFLSISGGGEFLARLLYPELDELPGGGISRATGWIRIPHTAEVDRRLVELVDIAATIRYNAPQLVQLELEPA